MMSEPGGKTYRPWEPQRYRQEAHSPAAKLPEGDVVVFLLAIVPPLAWQRFYAPYEEDTRGAPPCAPAMMVGLLLYASCGGVLSSRTSALACERTLACIAMGGPDRPDGRTISDGRKLHLEALKDGLVQGIRLAGAAGWVQWGTVSTDGTNIQGHASRHQAMRYGEMKQAIERWREASAALVTQADPQDAAEDAAWGSRRGDARPAELARREARLARLETARRR